ncbi:HLA class I histocompatibility antigen, C alpha chain-like [Nerophis lumbriciformis]|uniref:HLA class I histocompatibility antigen, C alpha chain-like n=1 Tax=Nerophis lumbriciformis TaxID=546530 RepID=UPI003BAB8096
MAENWSDTAAAFSPLFTVSMQSIPHSADTEQLMCSFLSTCSEILDSLHIYQRMKGCEWNDETDEIKSWRQSSYDGEDFLALDTKTWTWTAAKPQAVPIKQKLDRDRAYMDYLKFYHTGICVHYLKKYVNFSRDVLMRTVLPEVFLLQKTPSSPVSCFATGFYPSSAALFWRKDGKDLHENVVHGEMLPNPDGTFQMTVDLKVEVTAKVEGKYECVFQLSGVKEDLVTKLERRSIMSNASNEGEKDTLSGNITSANQRHWRYFIRTSTIIDPCHKNNAGHR